MLDLFEVVLVVALWQNRPARGRESDGSVAGSDASPTDGTEDHHAVSAPFFTRVCSVATGVTRCPWQALPTFYVDAPFYDDGNVVSDRAAVANGSEL